MHYFSSNVGFTNIAVRSMGQSGADTKYRVPTVQGQWDNWVLSVYLYEPRIYVEPACMLLYNAWSLHGSSSVLAEQFPSAAKPPHSGCLGQMPEHSTRKMHVLTYRYFAAGEFCGKSFTIIKSSNIKPKNQALVSIQSLDYIHVYHIMCYCAKLVSIEGAQIYHEPEVLGWRRENRNIIVFWEFCEHIWYEDFCSKD